MERQGFVVVTTQRSGSSWLVDLLDSHPAARVWSEIFLDRPLSAQPWTAGLLPPMRFQQYRETVGGVRPFSTLAYLDWVAGLEPRARAFGFKLMYNHWRRYPEIALALVARRYKVVHLVRANAFDAYLSGLRVRETGEPHRLEAGSAPPRPLRVDAAACLHYVDRRERSVRRIRRLLGLLRLEVVELDYEALRRNLDGELRKVTGLLGVPGHRWQSRFQKIVSGRYESLVENWGEVRAALARRGYGSWLEDPPGSG